jgi:hypothetical protein
MQAVLPLKASTVMRGENSSGFGLSHEDKNTYKQKISRMQTERASDACD